MTGTFIHPLISFVDKTFVIAEFELRKLRHDFTELIPRALQPALWLLIFGQVFARSGMMHTGNIPYLDFIAPAFLRAKCSLRRYFLRNQRDLERTWESSRSPCQPDTSHCIGAWKGPFRRNSDPVPGNRGLWAITIPWSQAQLEPARAAERLCSRGACRHTVLNVLSHHCLHCEDPRALHGCWPGSDDAAVLRSNAIYPRTLCLPGSR